MPIEIRSPTDDELGVLLELNEAALPHVNSISLTTMQWFERAAFYCRVVVHDGTPAGFLVGLAPEAQYQSPNFHWFKSRYDDFVYIDRIVVSAHSRGQGFARQLYDDLVRAMPDTVRLLTCEVNARPRNDASMQFHERYGFVEVGRQETEGGAKEVVLMAKRL